MEGLAVDVRTAAFRAFDYVCPPGEPAWRTVNRTGDAWVLAFPHRQVGIGSPASEVVADAGLAVLYGPRQEYRRRLVDPRGDSCDAVGLTGEAVAELSGGRIRAAPPSAAGLPVPAAALLRQRVLFRRLRRSRTASVPVPALEVTEELTAVLATVLGSGPATAPARRPSTVRRHAELVEAAREVLGRDLADDVQLSDVAAAVGTAPHHLARVFRAGTGSSLHAYRVQLRLRAAVDAVLDGSPVGEVAHAVGFSSHAHLTDSFRQVFGRPPSALARLLDAPA